MKSIKAGLVIAFEKNLKEKVHDYLGQNPNAPIVFDEDETHAILEFNRKDTENFSAWLDETLSILNYRKYCDFFKLADSSILHIYLPAEGLKDKFELSLNTEQLIILRKLSTVFDIDYAVFLDISDI